MAVETVSKELSSAQKEFQSLLNDNLKNFSIKEGQTVQALVTEITPKFVILDLKYKQEAMISIDELGKELEKIKVGSTIPVYVERLESFKNELVVSYTKAKSMETWNKMLEAFKSGKEVIATLTSKIKGGYVANCEGLHCFVPASQLDIKPLHSVSHLMGQPLKFIAVRVDTLRGNISLSRRALLEKSKDEDTKKALKNLKEGDIVEGRVQAIVDWGAFIDLNSVISLLHVSDLSWGRITKPSDLLTLNQTLKVMITKIDKISNRVSVSVKALTSSPYEDLDKTYKVGSIHKGIVQKNMDYGTFIRIGEIEGLLHSSQISWTDRNPVPSKYFSPSQEVSVKIVSIEKNTKRVSLSYKETFPNPWKEIEGKVGTVVEVIINNITDKAIFANLDNGLTGMIPAREIHWSEEGQDLKKFKKNDKISVKIIELKNEKLRLSIRQAGSKDPFDIFKEKKWALNSIITTQVYEVLKTGVKVSIDPEKKIIVMIKKNQLAKESADARSEIYTKGNRIDAMITELNLASRVVSLSVKASEIYQEKSLIAKFGAGAARSGATLAGIFQKALGKTPKMKKERKNKKED